MPAKEFVLVQYAENGVVTVTLNSPPLNLMTVAMNQRLAEILTQLRQDDGVRVVIVTGAGPKAFCAGADIKEFSAYVADGTMVSQKLQLECSVLDQLAELPQPTIAALNGITLGGGLELALCCDYRILGEQITVGFPEIQIGLFPGSGGLVRLPNLIGASKAKQLMLFGEHITAQQALELGLVNQVVPNEQVLAAARDRANQLASYPRHTLRAIKQGVHDVCGMSDQAGVRYSLGLMSRILNSADAKEGVSAFIEKRPPRFNR